MDKLKRITQEKFDSLKNGEKELLLSYYKTYEKENELINSLTKFRKKTKKVKEKLNKLQIKKKKIIENIKSINKTLFTSSTIVCDKRWNSYICIFKNSESQKSLYLGSHKSIIKALAPFYPKDEFKNSQEFLKEELKKIISSVQDKLIKHNNNNEITFKKNKLKNIVKLYAESGKWDYWSIEDEN
tara:strand:- start:926 stop:1480 length:555 start_codon:yes stop_codon:yes gene_type:complete